MLIAPVIGPLVDPLRNPLRGGGLPWEPKTGGAAWSPLLISSLRLWLNERDLVTTSSVYSAWGDQAPPGNDLAQATASLRPEDDATINGYAAPHFDGSDDRMDGAAISGLLTASAWHAFAVFRLDVNDVADGSFFEEDPIVCDLGGFWGIFVSTSGIHVGQWDGAAKATAREAVSVDTNYLIEASFDGTTLRHRLAANTAVTTTSGNISTMTGALRLGQRNATGRFDGKIASVLLFNAKLDTGAANQTRAHLGIKYGVTY